MLIGLPKFDYLACDSLEEAFDLLSRYAGISRILAGGTDLYVKMKHRRLMPQYLIDIKKIPDLKGIHYDEQPGLRIGALTSIEEINTMLFQPFHHRTLNNEAAHKKCRPKGPGFFWVQSTTKAERKNKASSKGTR